MWLVKLVSYSLGIPYRAYAAGCTGGGLCNPLGNLTLQQIANSVIAFLFNIGGPIAAIMVLVGGYQMMTAAGNPEQFSKGKMTILYAAAGLVVILLAGSIENLIVSIFGGP